MNNLSEILVVIGGFVGSAFGIVKLTIAQQRNLTDRFVGFLESSLKRQDETIESFSESVARLNDNVRENTLLVRQIAERLAAGDGL